MKDIDEVLGSVYERDYLEVPLAAESEAAYGDVAAIEAAIEDMQREMKDAARRLEFEHAAALREDQGAA